MEKIVALCKRRGFVFPSSEIYGGLGSTYDYGHYGVLLKTNVKQRVVARDAPGARRHRRARLARSSSTRGCGRPAATSTASPTRWSTAAPARSASAPTTSTDELCPAKANLPKTEDRRHEFTEARDFNLMFKTIVGPVEETGVGRLPAPGDGAGHLHQLQERPAVQPPQAAVRHRADRQVVPQRDHAGQLHLPHARVRADGDGVLRAAGRGAATGTSTGRTSASPGTRTSGSAPTTCACASTTPTSCQPLLVGHRRRRVPLPHRLVRARGHRQPRRLRPHRATPSSAARSSSTSTRRPASATSRTSSSRPPAPTARRSRSSSTPTTRRRSRARRAPCCGCTRGSRR